MTDATLVILLIPYGTIAIAVTLEALSAWASSPDKRIKRSAARRALLGFAWPALMLAAAISLVAALARDATRRIP